MNLTIDLVITFGKYWGKKYGEICKLDKQYSEWVKKEWKDLQKHIKLPKVKIEEKEEVYEVPKVLGQKFLCYSCLSFVCARNSVKYCLMCSKYRKDLISKLVILRHQREIKKGNLIF